MHTRFWKNDALQIKDAAFKKIKAKAIPIKLPLKLLNLKGSL